VTSLQRSAREALAQLQSSRILRWGLVLVVVLLWSEGLARLDAYSLLKQEEGRQARGEVARLQALQREQAWPARREEARRLLDLQERLLWQAPSAGLAEAALQDWMRGISAKVGVGVKDLQVSRVAAVPKALPQARAELGAMRVQLVGEFRRLPVLALLQEVALHERGLVVDRLLLMPASQPPLFELELRAATLLVAPGPAAPPREKPP